MVDEIARRRPADPPLLARIARLAHGVRAALPDGARLPQHHAARVLPRRARSARAAVLPRPPRAAARTDRASTSRSAIRSSIARSSRPLGFAPTAVLPVVPGFAHLDGPAGPARARRVRRRVDEHPVRRARRAEQAAGQPDPVLPRVQDALQPRRPAASSRGRTAGSSTYLAQLHALVARARRATTCTSSDR